MRGVPEEVVEAIARQRSAELLRQFLDAAPAKALTACDSKLWSVMLKAFPDQSLVPIFQGLPDSVILEHAEYRETLFGLAEAMLKSDAPPATADVVDLLIKYSPQPPPARSYCGHSEPGPTHPGDATESHVLLAASYLIGAEGSRDRARSFLAGDGALEHLRHVLAPALLASGLRKRLKQSNSLFPEFLQSAISDLESEVAKVLKPYPDFARPRLPLGGNGGELETELRAFLLDAAAESHDFRRRQSERDRIAEIVRRHRLDVKMTTIKKGSPHTLRCVKTVKSYARAVKRREDDRALLAKLRKLEV